MAQPSRGSLPHLRLANRAAVLETLKSSGPLSRADLARTTGLSRTTVSSLVLGLIGDGVVHEGQDRGTPHKGGSGRPPTLLYLVESSECVVGVDLGHRHVRVAAADLACHVLAQTERRLDVDDDANQALRTAADLVGEVLEQCGREVADVARVGLGVPGPIDADTGTITSAILPGWFGRTPGAEFAKLSRVPVSVDNDANLGALGELRHGAARGLEDVIYVKASAGLGAGIILGGRLHRGATGIAGEIGHVQLAEGGPVCRCGSRGCIETQVAAPRLVEVLQPAHDEVLTVESMLSLARDGDSGVNRVLDDAGRTIGRVLADLCNHLNPSAIIVGGALGGASALLDGIRDSVDRYAQPNIAAAIDVSPSTLGEHAETMGALELALEAGAVAGTVRRET